ncbi:hypothetical protein PISMIDRAFT_685709 [Pisolithus microcarpus 441]|uniref:Uncharacterized protein n=1 Tax=Pisolithus microcarpus 441 TaxID=765257 RepID=A0A0C9Z3T9_9AGAM|nr:hypothetical protein PISMIDRAFT_685709 [Pisolithus microcarpus 441]
MIPDPWDSYGIVQGRTEYLSNDTRVRCTPGYVALVSRTVDSDGPYEAMWVDGSGK